MLFCRFLCQNFYSFLDEPQCGWHAVLKLLLAHNLCVLDLNRLHSNTKWEYRAPCVEPSVELSIVQISMDEPETVH